MNRKKVATVMVMAVLLTGIYFTYWIVSEFGPTLTLHVPISITSNDDFAEQGWAGDGTSSSPYRISGLSIDENADGYSIIILDTTVHFVIDGCVLNDRVVFYNVSNFVIQKCSIYDSNVTLDFEGVSNGKIQLNNIIVESGEVLSIWEGRFSRLGAETEDMVSHEVTIFKNNFSETSGYGGWIGLGGPRAENKAFTHINFVNNTLNDIGLGVINCENINISGNMITSEKIAISYSAQALVEDNVISGSGGFGLDIEHSSSIRVLNNTIIGHRRGGVYVMESEYCDIMYNDIALNNESGVSFYDSHYSNVTFNQIHDNGEWGLWIYGTNINCSNNTYEDNVLGDIYEQTYFPTGTELAPQLLPFEEWQFDYGGLEGIDKDELLHLELENRWSEENLRKIHGQGTT